jgi:hypothetical protein
MIENGKTDIQRVSGGRVPRIGALGLALAVGGCDGQAEPSYRGEPLMSVSGRVEAGLSSGEVEVGVLWLTSDSEFDLVCTGEASASGQVSACALACGEITCATLDAWDACASSCPDVTEVVVDVRPPSAPFLTGGVGQTTPVVGEFPAQFSLDILEPPPAEALIASTTGERLAIGSFAALDPSGAPFRVDLSQLPSYPPWLLGGSESHILVFTPDGVPEGSLWSQASGLTLEPGFHLLEVLAAEADEQGELRRVPDGEASQVSLRIAPPDTIAWPLMF